MLNFGTNVQNVSIGLRTHRLAIIAVFSIVIFVIIQQIVSIWSPLTSKRNIKVVSKRHKRSKHDRILLPDQVSILFWTLKANIFSMNKWIFIMQKALSWISHEFFSSYMYNKNFAIAIYSNIQVHSRWGSSGKPSWERMGKIWMIWSTWMV